MRYFINPETQAYYQYDDNHDFEKYPLPAGLVSCPIRPEFGVWVNGAWSIDSAAQNAALLQQQLNAIDSAVAAELRSQNFDNQAQLNDYAARDPQYAPLHDWVYAVNLMWDSVQSGAVKYSTLKDCIDALPPKP